jgi:putative ABC transport system ATP-binding protein
MSVFQVDRAGMHYDLRGQKIIALAPSSLSAQQEEFIVVRGKSGAGKTTLLSILGGMLRPTEGRVHLGSVELTALGPAARAKLRQTSIGFVFQSMHLLPYLDLLDNTRLAGGSEARARELLEQLGLGARIHHRPAELSAGERQRGAVARALVHGPALVLADEPTGNLDPESAALVLEAFQSFRTNGGCLMMATHSQEPIPGSRTVYLGPEGLHSADER